MLGAPFSTRACAAVLLMSLFVAPSGCEGDGASTAAPATSTDEAALITLPRLGAWARFHIAGRGRTRIRVVVEPSVRYAATVSDHWGFRHDRARPAPTLDLDVRDDHARSLTGTVHNTSRDDNGTEPDRFLFTAPASGAAVIDLREVDGFGGDFEVRVDAEAGPAADATPPPGVVVHVNGDATSDVTPLTTSAVLLAGGGRDHDAATSALVAAGGNGDAVILRMDDTGGAYATYFVERGAHAATEIAFDPAAGNDDVTGAALVALRARSESAWIVKRIDAAEILFVAGGNQTKYVDAWHDTALAAAVNRLIARGGVIGGTSAGMHALGGVVHTPRGAGDSVTSAVALVDPYVDEGEHPGTRSLAFAPSPFSVPLLARVVTDTHWSQRARLGRSVTFLGRVLTDHLGPLGQSMLVACDEGVAVLFDAGGHGRVFGPASGGAAFLFRPDVAPDRCVDDRSLDWRAGVAFVRVDGTQSGTGTLDLDGPVGPSRARVADGVLSAP